MTKFKIGDKVVVVDELSTNGDYDNGDVGIITKFDTPASEACFVERETDGLSMNVYFSEIEHLREKEMNAEQIRDEIIRIDVRIGEAKKDIENAEKERNSLVEKLREKGFEIIKPRPIPKDIMNLDEVVVGETYIVTNNFGEAEDRFVGEKVIVTDIDEYANTLFVYVNMVGTACNDWMHYRDLAKI